MSRACLQNDLDLPAGRAREVAGAVRVIIFIRLHGVEALT